MKNYKALIAIRGMLPGRDVPEGAVISLGSTEAGMLRGLVEETGEEVNFELGAMAAPAGLVGIAEDDVAGLVKALTSLGAIVILPHDDGSFDLTDIPVTALLAGVVAKIGAGDISVSDLSMALPDVQLLNDLAYRLNNGLDPARVAALLPLPTAPADEGAGAAGDDAAPKKSTKKTAAQE